MIAFVYALIAVGFVVLGIGGIMYLDHRFSLEVGERDFAIRGRNIVTDDPFVRRIFRKFFMFRVAYSVVLLVLLIVAVSHVG